MISKELEQPKIVKVTSNNSTRGARSGNDTQAREERATAESSASFATRDHAKSLIDRLLAITLLRQHLRYLAIEVNIFSFEFFYVDLSLV
jgi:hypothetical protein